MKILVLGSDGLIGSHLVKHLEKLGHFVNTIDIAGDSFQDLRVVGRIREIMDWPCDFIFFLAFDVGGSKYLAKYQDSFDFIQNNSKIMVNTFGWIKERRIPFLFTSSQMSNMFDTNYGLLKALGERYTKSLGGLNARLWNVYGPEVEGEKSHVITDFIKMAVDDGEIRMRTDGMEIRQFLHVDDCCEAFSRLMDNYHEIVSKSFDITSFQWRTIAGVAGTLHKLTGCKVTKGSDHHLQQKINQPYELINHIWCPKIKLEDGISQLLDNYRQ